MNSISTTNQNAAIRWATLALGVVALGLGGWLFTQQRYELNRISYVGPPPYSDGIHGFLSETMVVAGDVAFQGIKSDSSYPIFRAHDGKVETLAGDEGAEKVRVWSLAVDGPKTYFAQGELLLHENGRIEPVSSSVEPMRRRMLFDIKAVDAKRGMLAFYSSIGGLCSLKDGRLVQIAPPEDCVGITADDVAVGRGRVFFRCDKGIFGSTDAGAELLAAEGAQVGEHRLDRIRSLSVGDDGEVKFVAGLIDESRAVYRIVDGKIERFVEAEHPDEKGSFIATMATNGRTTAVLEYMPGLLEVGHSHRWEVRKQRIVVHRTLGKDVIATVGDTMFGETSTGFSLGTRSVDSAGTIAFTYGLVDGSNGIVTATPTRSCAILGSLTAIVGVGLIVRQGFLIRHGRRIVAAPQVGPT